MNKILKCKTKIIKQAFPKSNSFDKENTYRIFQCKPVERCDGIKLTNGGYFSIKGDISFLDVNEEYDLDLELIETNKYGSSYAVNEVLDFKSFENLTLEDSRKILHTMASINNTETLLTNYPNFIKDMLEHGKEYFDLSKLKGIKNVKISSYEKNLNVKFKFFAIQQRLKLYKLTIQECQQLCATFKTADEVEKQIQDNPYNVLINILKRKFVTENNNNVDNMLVKGKDPLRIDLKLSFERCEAMVLYVLNLNESGGNGFVGGNTRMSVNTLWNYAKTYDLELAKMMKDICVDSENIYYDKKSGYVSKMTTYQKECKIAKFIKKLVNNNSVLDWDWTKFTEIKEGFLTEEQQQALKCVCENRLTIVNSKSGSGKSATIKAILSMIKYYNECFTQVARTGRASKVLNIMTNEKASTIHRLAFKEKETYARFIICDEFSFNSVDLLDMLISTITNNDCRLILVGDTSQMTPISEGNTAMDLISWDKIQTVSFSKCFRYNSSGISKAGEDCRCGKMYINQEDINKKHIVYGENKDYQFYKSDGTLEQIGRVYQDTLKKYNCSPYDVTVITPMNVGTLGTLAINNYIQELVNPYNDKQKTIDIKRNGVEISFRENDIIICTKNMYDVMPENVYNELLQDESLSKEDFSNRLVELMNGEICKVLEICDDCMKIQSDEDILVLTKKDCSNILLSFSVSSHRLQGSTLQHSIIITSNQHKKMLCREMSYVALTRARKSVTEIGDISAIEYAVNTKTNDTRETWLGYLLNKEED